MDKNKYLEALSSDNNNNMNNDLSNYYLSDKMWCAHKVIRHWNNENSAELYSCSVVKNNNAPSHAHIHDWTHSIVKDFLSDKDVSKYYLHSNSIMCVVFQLITMYLLGLNNLRNTSMK